MKQIDFVEQANTYLYDEFVNELSDTEKETIGKVIVETRVRQQIQDSGENVTTDSGTDTCGVDQRNSEDDNEGESEQELKPLIVKTKEQYLDFVKSLIKTQSSQIVTKDGHKKARPRAYSFTMVTYADNQEFWQPLLERASQYVVAYHDKDKQDPHYHILLTFPRNYSVANLIKALDHEKNTNFGNFTFQIMNAPSEAFDYLDHKKQPDKHQYDATMFQYSDYEYWVRRLKTLDAPNTSKEISNDEFINDLTTYDAYTMARKYGRDYIKNYTKYEQFRRVLIGREDMEKFNQNPHHYDSIENMNYERDNLVIELNMLEKQKRDLLYQIRKLKESTNV